MTMKAITLCKLGMSVIEKVIDELKEIPQIKRVMSLTGDYDVLIEIVVDSSEELYSIFAKKIDLIEGIIDSNTHVVMRSWEK
ncbi:unnamed protein product [marine sediment metagenome]|uniref:Transcription regulator AsnC/Lrp ligand binding domain-containing protein n=1 Tax=marine sediment metagenome TaxID=412755 RepID=X1EZ03_9ZZZZ